MGKGKCPERIVGNAVHGLVCGLLGGALYVGGTGMMRGMKPQATLAHMKGVPYIGAQTAVFVAIYSIFDCFIKGVRGEDGVFNRIVSGAATGAIYGVPRGKNSVIVGATVGAAVAVVCDQ